METIENIKEHLKNDNFKWSRHALEKCDMYGYDEEKIIYEVVEQGELIEYHYWHGYGDKYLVYVESKEYGVYHCVIINNEVADIIIIKTVYKPDNTFKKNQKTRSNPTRVL